MSWIVFLLLVLAAAEPVIRARLYNLQRKERPLPPLNISGRYQSRVAPHPTEPTQPERKLYNQEDEES